MGKNSDHDPATSSVWGLKSVGLCVEEFARSGLIIKFGKIRFVLVNVAFTTHTQTNQIFPLMIEIYR